MKKYFFIILVFLVAGTVFFIKHLQEATAEAEKLEGVYVFDSERYLTAGDMSSYLSDLGLRPEDIIRCMETGEEISTGDAVVDTAARLIVQQVQELSYSEISFLEGGYFLLKMYITDSDRILVNARRYCVIEHEGSVWRFCLYDGHNNYLGLKEAVLDNGRLALKEDNSEIFFKKEICDAGYGTGTHLGVQDVERFRD